MRKTIWRFIVTLLPLAVALSLASCQRTEFDLQDPEPSIQDGKTEVVITASIADATGETRTSYNEGEAKNYWSPGDKIKVFSAGESSEFTSLNTEPATMVKFKGLISFITGTSDDSEDSKDYVWGLYPYSTSASYYEPDGISRTARITSFIPILQTGVAGTFGDNLAVMIGRSESLSIPFRGAYSGAFFQVSRSDIVSMTLRGLNGETLAGNPTYKFNDSLLPEVTAVGNPKTSVTVVAPNGAFEPLKNYYLITLPDVALPDGYSVTLRRSDGYEGTYEVRANRPLNRIKFRNLSEPVDLRIENSSNIANGTSTGWVRASSSVPLNEIHYTTTDGEAIQYNTSYAGFTGNEVDESGCVAPADNGGVGIIRFTSPIVEIDDSAFEGATNLSSVSWPSTVVSIRDASFSGCVNLEDLSFDGIEYIGIEAFKNCGIRNLVLPEGLQSVGQRPFRDCASLESVTLPQSLEAPTLSMFVNCPNLREFNGAFASADHRCLISDVTSGKALWAFAPAGLGPNSTYVIPEGVTTISSYAFSGYDIGRVILPESLDVIGTYAFLDCSSLKDLTLPANLTRIYTSAFNNCTSLQWIKILRTSSIIESRGGRTITNTNDCPIFVPSNLLDQYKTAANWSYFADRFKANQPDYAIWYTTTDGAAASYTLPEAYQGYASTIQNIAPANNNSAPGIGWLKFPINLTEIPEGLFQNCANLQTVWIPDGVEHIGVSAFKNCNHLEDVQFGSGVSYIDKEAFSNCNLSDINLPNSLVTMGFAIFYNNPLTTVRLPENTTQIIENPFEHCESLVSFTGDSPLVADEGRCLINAEGTLFSYAPAAVANRYVVPSNVKRISFGAFKCATFQSVVIPASVETISGYTFDDCPNLTTIEIRGGGRNLRIGLGMIRNCPQLRRINMASAVPPFFMSTPNSMEWDIPETCQIAIPGAGSCTYDSSEYPSWRQLRDHFFYYQADNEIWYHYANNSVSATLNSSNDFGAQSTNDFVMFIDRSQIGSYVPFPASIEPDSRIVIAVAEFDGIVTKIPEDVFSSQYFSNQLALDWVSLPGQVTTIGNRAFKGNSSLPSFPVCANNVLTTIGDEAFMDCSSMVNGGTGSYAVSLPSSVTTIGARAFQNCTSLNRINAPGVTSLGEEAFSNCAGLYYVNMGSLTVVKDQTFYSCAALEMIHTGELSSIGKKAFCNCVALMDVGKNINDGIVQLPNITSLPEYAFYRCNSVEAIRLPNLTAAYANAFGELGTATTLTELYVPKLASVTGLYVFGHIKMDDLNLPYVTSIPKSTFGYSKIKTIRFGSSLSYFGGNDKTDLVFNSIQTLPERHLYFEGTTPPTFGTYALFTDYNVCEVLLPLTSIHVPAGCKEAYKTALHNANSAYDAYFGLIVEDI